MVVIHTQHIVNIFPIFVKILLKVTNYLHCLCTF